MKLTKLTIYCVKMSENSFKLYNLLIWKVNLLISLKRQMFKSFRCVYTRTTRKVNWQCYNNIFNDLYIKNIWCTFSTWLFCIYFRRFFFCFFFLLFDFFKEIFVFNPLNQCLRKKCVHLVCVLTINTSEWVCTV